MSGNTAQSDKVLDSSYNLVQPGMDLQSWKEQQRHHARKRVLGLQALLALAHLGAPQPVHGTDLIDLDRAMDQVDYNLNRLSRQAADAFTLTHPGHGGMYVPADCPLVVALDPRHNHRRVTVIHAGYRGLAANIVGRTLGQVPFTAHETRVYVAPHAYEGFELSGEALEHMQASPVTRGHLKSMGPAGGYWLDFAGAIRAQLNDRGVKDGQIATSTENSLSEPSLFSHRNQSEKGANGRNGVMVGIRADT